MEKVGFLFGAIFLIFFWGGFCYIAIKNWRQTASKIPNEESTVGLAAGPWSRFLARVFDMLFGISIFAFIFLILFGFLPSFDEIKNPALENFLVGLIYMPPALVLEAFFLSKFGTTLGKAIFGIKVLASNDLNLTFRDAVVRNFRMWLYGYSLGFPLILLFTCSINYRKVAAGKRVSWDNPQKVNVTQAASTVQIIMGIIATIVLFTVIVWPTAA